MQRPVAGMVVGKFGHKDWPESPTHHGRTDRDGRPGEMIRSASARWQRDRSASPFPSGWLLGMGPVAVSRPTRSLSMHIAFRSRSIRISVISASLPNTARPFSAKEAIGQSAFAGIVWTKPFGHDEDWLGLAFGWADPTRTSMSPKPSIDCN